MDEDLSRMESKNNPAEALVKAFKLQEELRKMRKEIRDIEAEYDTIMGSLIDANVGRIGIYELVTKVQHKRAIDSDLFRTKWPGIFNKIAKVTLKDAEANLRPEDLVEFEKVLKVEHVLRHSIVSYERLPLQ